MARSNNLQFHCSSLVFLLATSFVLINANGKMFPLNFNIIHFIFESFVVTLIKHAFTYFNGYEINVKATATTLMHNYMYNCDLKDKI